MGLGLIFTTINVSASGPLTLPAGNASALFLARVARNRRLDLTRPPAADGSSRMVTIKRLDSSGRVIIHAASGEQLDQRNGPIDLDDRGDFVTFVSDGTAWYVFASGR